MIEWFYFINRQDPNCYLPLQVKVDQRIMAIKLYSPFPQTPGIEPHHQLQFGVIRGTLV